MIGTGGLGRECLAVTQWSEGLAKVPSGMKVLCLCVSMFLVMKQMGIC